eukprot:TRINITY_DN3704_c0_g1_i7.p1 TRINITY_DN3704_c0_g1~~TRINITY_DN3704_c0_g1_i7.p1  ORF type:complete len:300 (-),score=102.62 TRINITY_DN3704_c0_g1_i7:175-1074(-)
MGKEITVKVQSRKGKDMGEFTVHDDDNLEHFQKLFAKQNSISVHRQQFNVGEAKGKMLTHDKPLSEFGIEDQTVLVFKDRGAQIGWRLVYIIEYAGPLLLYPLFYYFPEVFYGEAVEHNYSQKVALGLWSFHMLKREYESMFVHTFSSPTMPLRNIFKNCGYYWTAGLGVGYMVNSPSFVGQEKSIVKIAAAFFILFEILNGIVHAQMANLRKGDADKRKHKIPHGILFTGVTCPNYFYEFMAWAVFNIVAPSVAGIIFCVVGLLQMTQWAGGKKKRYLREFGDEYKKLNRAKIIPFIY